MRNFVLCFNSLLICLGWSTWVNAQVLSNEKITVSIGNKQSWTGRNGTGNLSYYGCDDPSSGNLVKQQKPALRQDNCVYLTGGKITCRDGVCRTTWQNQKYYYVLSSPITDQINAQLPSTLTIYLDSKVVLEEELYLKPFDNIEY